MNFKKELSWKLFIIFILQWWREKHFIFQWGCFSCRVLLRTEGEFGKTNTPHLINIIPFFFLKKCHSPFLGFRGITNAMVKKEYRKQIYKVYIKIIVCTLPHFCWKRLGGWTSYQILKKGGGRDRTSIFKAGLLWKRGVTFFEGVAIFI